MLRYRSIVITGWNYSKVFSRLISQRCSLFADSNVTYLLQREQLKFCPKVTHFAVDLSVSDIRWQIVAKWLKIAQWSQWTAYRIPPLLFRMVRSVTHTNSPSHRIGVSNAPLVICRVSNGHISARDDPIHFMFGPRIGFPGRRIEWRYFYFVQT